MHSSNPTYMESLLTPEQRAIRRRDDLLKIARHEAWPQSDALCQQLRVTSPVASREQSARDRADGHLLGIWSAEEHTFYHPNFQFCAEGHVHSQLPELLTALSAIPTFAPNQDPGGWGRLGWLYQPRGALSELSIAENASEDGVAPNEAHLARDARTPAEVFCIHAGAVIALAREDAETMLDRR